MVVVEVQGAPVQEYIFQARPNKREITPLAFRSQVRVAMQVNDETSLHPNWPTTDLTGSRTEIAFFGRLDSGNH